MSSSIDSGKYKTVSEVVGSSFRFHESEDERIRAISYALIEGEESVMIDDFDVRRHLEDLHRKHL